MPELSPDNLTISALAGDAYDWFESFDRDGSDKKPWRCKDGAPEWISDMVREAHGEFLPDDWRYDRIHSVLGCVHDSGAESRTDFVDSFNEGDLIDTYHGARATWLASHLSRGAYVNEAVDKFGSETIYSGGVYDAIGWGQYEEVQEIAASVLGSLDDRLSEATESAPDAADFGDDERREYEQALAEWSAEYATTPKTESEAS